MTLCRVGTLLEADLPAVRALHLECLALSHWLPAPARTVVPQDFETAAISRHESGRVARAPDGALLGFLAYQADGRFVRNLYVRPSARGQGVGAALLKALPIGPAWQLKCVQANAAALGFYAAQGWSVVGEGRSGDGLWLRLQSPMNPA